MIGIFLAPSHICYACGEAECAERMTLVARGQWLCEYCNDEAQSEDSEGGAL